MNSDAQHISSPSPRPVLTQSEASRRLLKLAGLQTALTNLGVRSVLARHRRLVLRWHSAGPFGPSGPTDPELHIFTPAGTTVATTDGTVYHLLAGQQGPAADPVAAAALIPARQGAL